MRAALFALLVACGSKEAPPVPAPTPAAPGAKGTIETRTFHSDALGVDKDYVVYLPAGYADKPNAKWPVFYYLHGLTGNEQSWVRGGHIDDAADKLGLAAIIVMPDGDDGFYADSQRAVDYDACMKDGTGLFMPAVQPKKQTCVRHHLYETYIAKDLVANVDGHYRTIASREGRGIAGMSMGGLGALELAMRHPDEFAAAASHSGVDALMYKGPHPYIEGMVQLYTAVANPNGNEIIAWLDAIYGTDVATWKSYDPATLAQKVEPGKPALYMDCGTEDEFLLYDQMQYLHEVLTARHIEHAYFIGPGHHNFSFWIPRLPDSLSFLREHVAKPS